MHTRLAALALCLVFVGAAACTGGQAPVSASGPSTVTSRGSKATVAGLPRVMAQMGTDYSDGALVQFCKGDACQRGTARPTRTLKGNDPLLFIVDQKPLTARAELRASGAAEPVETAPLKAGTTMLFAPKTGPGSYLMTLTATWKGKAGSWVFRVSIPRD